MKRCEDCIHFNTFYRMGSNLEFISCRLTNLILKKENANTCQLYNVDISKKHICYNCKYFLGGRDWGLACSKHYYNVPKALDRMCEDGEFN